MIESVRDRLTKAVDAFILAQLGTIPVPLPASSDFGPVDPDLFWRESWIHQPAPVSVAREFAPRDNGRVRVVDLEGPSRGLGTHPGSTKFMARAHLRHDIDDAPTVLLLHGFAIPVAWYEELQCRLLTRRGANVIRLDHPFHLRRRARGKVSGEGYMGAEPQRLATSVRQSVEDAAALIAWARERSSQVSVMGVSLGGCAATLLSALVELDAMVAVAPFCDPAATLLQSLPYGTRYQLGLAGRDAFEIWGSSDFESAYRALSSALAPIIAKNFDSPKTPAQHMTLVRPLLDGIVGEKPIAELAARWDCEMWDENRHGHVSVLNARGLTSRIHDRLLHPAPLLSVAPSSMAG